jgi:hypothetical protein
MANRRIFYRPTSDVPLRSGEFCVMVSIKCLVGQKLSLANGRMIVL